MTNLCVFCAGKMQATLRQTERQLIRLQVGFMVLLHGWNQLELYSNPHHRGRLSWKKLELMRESSRCGTATAAAASACPTSLPPLLLTLSRQLEAEVDSLRAQVRCDPSSKRTAISPVCRFSKSPRL